MSPSGGVAACLYMIQKRSGQWQPMSDEEKACQCWLMIDRIQDDMCIEIVAAAAPLSPATVDVPDSKDEPKVKSRRWCRAAFTCDRLSSEVEIDSPVPTHIPAEEVQLLPTYLRLLQVHRDDDAQDGVACDVPTWAKTWINLSFWSMDGMIAFVDAIKQAEKELQPDTGEHTTEDMHAGQDIDTPLPV